MRENKIYENREKFAQHANQPASFSSLQMQEYLKASAFRCTGLSSFYLLEVKLSPSSSYSKPEQGKITLRGALLHIFQRKKYADMKVKRAPEMKGSTAPQV